MYVPVSSDTAIMLSSLGCQSREVIGVRWHWNRASGFGSGVLKLRRSHTEKDPEGLKRLHSEIAVVRSAQNICTAEKAPSAPKNKLSIPNCVRKVKTIHLTKSSHLSTRNLREHLVPLAEMNCLRTFSSCVSLPLRARHFSTKQLNR